MSKQKTGTKYAEQNIEGSYFILLSSNMQKFFLMILIRLSLKNPFPSSLSSINLAKQLVNEFRNADYKQD